MPFTRRYTTSNRTIVELLDIGYGTGSYSHSTVTTTLTCINSAIKHDISRKLLFFRAPAFDAPVRGYPLVYCHNVRYGKTIMVWLPDGKKSFMTRLAIFDRILGCDRQTDTDGQLATVQSVLCIASCSKNQKKLKHNLVGKGNKQCYETHKTDSLCNSNADPGAAGNQSPLPQLLPSRDLYLRRVSEVVCQCVSSAELGEHSVKKHSHQLLLSVSVLKVKVWTLAIAPLI